MNESNKRIAKNTGFLYFRMLFAMLISLYTSRVILQELGVDDYGIYQSVGGIVGFLSFVISALNTGTSRFLTFELGAGDFEKLKRTFSTTLTIHILLTIAIIILAETVGLWFLHHKLIIPAERMGTAVYVFHISVLTAAFTMTQVPYNASIIAHEKIKIFAYVGIVDVVLKLVIAFLLKMGAIDKLKFYATLLFVLQVSVILFYRFYCNRHFRETKYKFVFDKSIFKPILSFSGWSLFANGAFALNNSGVLMLLNMFFSPAVVAARAISIQVNVAITQFVDSFRTAVNPQIVKRYAAGEHQSSKKLLLTSTKYAYFLMFALCLPVYLLADPILTLWLGDVPDYAVIFVQLILIQSLFQVLEISFYTALYTKGRLKENALLSPTLIFLQFPVIYFLFKAGHSPVVLSWINIISSAILAIVIKPALLVKVVGYRWSDIWSVFKSCLWVTCVTLPAPVLLNHLLDHHTIPHFLIILFATLGISMLSIYFIGMEKETQKAIRSYLSSFLRGLIKKGP